MTRGLAIICTALVLLPGFASGETVSVRSGDHDGFTRLLVQFAAPEDWVFGRVDGGFELRPKRTDIDYRVEGIYDRIGRQRIAAVEDQGAGRLFLAVDCACHASAEELVDGQVVLDVIRGPARVPGTGDDAPLPPLPEIAPSEVPPPQQTAEPLAQPAAPDMPKVDPASNGLAEVVGDRAELPSTLPRLRLPLTFPTRPAEQPAAAETDRAVTAVDQGHEPEVAPDVAEEAPVDTLPDGLDPAARARVDATETALLEQIARAAAQGLLDADTGDIDRRVAAATPPPADSTPPEPETPPPAPPKTPRSHVTIETSVDRAAARPSPLQPETDDGDLCIDPSYFDVLSWGGAVGNGADIGAYRSNLVGEFDIADGAGLTALARNYVYVSFGAEAKALLARFPDEIDRPDVLHAMADVMDNGFSALAPELEAQMACPGATALWATLAQPELRPSQAIDREAVALAFNGLPAHLRRHLGPGLSDDFLAAGDRETAELIRAGIERLGADPSTDLSMLSAEFSLDDGNHEEAEATYDDVIAAGDEELPHALLARVELTLEGGGAVSEDHVLLLDGLALQHRGTETGRRVVDAAIRARASGGAFAEAFAQLEEAIAEGHVAPGRAAELVDDIFSHLAVLADDPGFLVETIARLDAATSLPPETRRQIATRLFDLGLTGPAQIVLEGDGAIPTPDDRRLFARAALVERRPDVAIGYLAGLTEAEDLRLRAAALEMAKDHAGAVRSFAAAGDHEAELQAAWRGGLWATVSDLDDGATGHAAALMLDKPATPGAVTDDVPREAGADPTPVPTTGTAAGTEDLPPLAAAQALIETSRATRDALGALLDQLPSPVGANEASAEPGS